MSGARSGQSARRKQVQCDSRPTALPAHTSARPPEVSAQCLAWARPLPSCEPWAHKTYPRLVSGPRAAASIDNRSCAILLPSTTSQQQDAATRSQRCTGEIAAHDAMPTLEPGLRSARGRSHGATTVRAKQGQEQHPGLRGPVQTDPKGPPPFACAAPTEFAITSTPLFARPRTRQPSPESVPSSHEGVVVAPGPTQASGRYQQQEQGETVPTCDAGHLPAARRAGLGAIVVVVVRVASNRWKCPPIRGVSASSRLVAGCQNRAAGSG
ncbi:uncharacterized protein PSFLO_06738 [Pseudozyma flocculosa]|uniref:Uncharacterized protein n=1 Tax=Pseudozyma flocculosa TaxID=84751 RepID=A0A5C3FAX4_9BASI|nr:uncharacterized protein PSFLO_06738 [Pseudozyma flocculosa]